MGKQAPPSFGVEANLLRQRLQEVGEVELVAVGLSMWPLYRPGQRIRITPCEPDALEVGDVVLFEGRNHLVLHRVIKVRETMVLTQGDARGETDRWVSHDKLVGQARRSPLAAVIVYGGPVLRGSLEIFTYTFLRGSENT